MPPADVAEFPDRRAAGRRTDSTWVARTIAAAEHDREACFELGVAYFTGASGVKSDLIEAHMWFNLAAAGGHREAGDLRAEVSEEMTAREIAEAQRRARQWLVTNRRKAA